MLSDYKYSLSGIPAMCSSEVFDAQLLAHTWCTVTRIPSLAQVKRCKFILVPIKSSQELSLLKTHSDAIALPRRV